MPTSSDANFRPTQLLPYRTTPVFNNETLPAALKREHRTKAGVWGLIRLLEGELLLVRGDASTVVLDPETPGVIAPEEVHHVTLLGPMNMCIEFYDADPAGDVSGLNRPPQPDLRRSA